MPVEKPQGSRPPAVFRVDNLREELGLAVIRIHLRGDLRYYLHHSGIRERARWLP